MIFAFISTITDFTSSGELISSFLIDFSFYTILAGLIGLLLFRKEKGKILSKTILIFMMVAPLLYLVSQL